ncbi:hypothetical protein COCC4DRAFT_21519 [Bipolaris maydis ATCC 48331]|uniref:Uncharacterized protein n=2 Tax=Cochliobolus heterostrophus TaxID=5016 RepID=M2UK37_COCH5|nr:uncharacterized protein COCC4DRAFT_21519 [Bipolaris maydis ATCC 48331]EMD94026.1 hypothetical protein COCHEDRAFT_1027980 [Bipolaris maydis C5]ENI07672.1 hypothetical protein COCC4DRAFT_21519 [Bipolaris maydis ATCC 48331]KAJ6209480.1 hypothetical protein PSV09DRAFT_1027980 [Bipolaris maydis]
MCGADSARAPQPWGVAVIILVGAGVHVGVSSLVVCHAPALLVAVLFSSSSHAERESIDDSRSVAAQQRSSRIKARASKRDRKSGFARLPFWRCIAPDTGRAGCLRVAESDRHSPSPRRCVNSNSPTVVALVLARVPPAPS